MKISQNISVVGGAASTPVRSSGSGVSTPSILYDVMMKDWTLPEDLRGGTEAMIAKAGDYLPQEPAESDKAYQNRLRRSELYNIYQRTLTTITGMPFVKSVVVSGAPESLVYLERDIDGTGQSLTEFAYQLTIDALHYGVVHALCDFPQTEEGMNLKEWTESGLRPYFTHISPRQLIGWREDGKGGLENIRILERRIVGSEKNEWDDKIVDTVRVIYKDRVDVYEFDPELEDKDFRLTESHPHDFGEVPLRTAYGNRTGFMTGSPAMLDLARINLAHFQVSSDLRNTLHTASIPFILASGFSEGELENAEISASKIVVSDNTEARMSFIEHGGRAIGSGNAYLDRLEQQGAVLGADLLISKGVSRMTATARRIDQNESLSVLQIALRSVERMIEGLYKVAGDFIGVDTSDIHVSIGDGMSIANEPNPTNALIALMNTGLLTEEQAVEEAKRQGILSTFFKLSQERAGLYPANSKEAKEDEVEQEQTVEEPDTLPEENVEES